MALAAAVAIVRISTSSTRLSWLLWLTNCWRRLTSAWIAWLVDDTAKLAMTSTIVTAPSTTETQYVATLALLRMPGLFLDFRP